MNQIDRTTRSGRTIVSVLKETRPSNTLPSTLSDAPMDALVALVPSHVPLLTKGGLQVVVETGAGEAAGFDDDAYRARGADIAASRAELFDQAEVLLQVRAVGADPMRDRDDLALLRPHHVVIGMADPLNHPQGAQQLAYRGVTAFAMELIPRIARAQSMDVLSSLATIVGYKAVLLAAGRLPRLFPMLTTAAGTIPPARVLVIGAGVAGLQAIATARRLGAAVSGYDVRPSVKEQIESLGAKAVADVRADTAAETEGGYAKAVSEDTSRRQRELLTPVVAASDVVITTAAVPGRRAPVLLTRDMVARMATGSVIVDVAADRGGNCEVTRPDEAVVYHGVTVLGPTDLPSTVPAHASQMYGRNVANFLLHLCRDGMVHLNFDDEIIRETLITRGGAVVHPRILELLNPATDDAIAGRTR